MMKKLFFIPILALIFILSGCKEDSPTMPQLGVYTSIDGSTMGTTYHITYEDKVDYKPAIDSILIAFNKSCSTYDSNSTISLFNQSSDMFCYMRGKEDYFTESLTRALAISEETGGAFDPSIMPLVNYWGFGYAKREKITTPSKKSIDSLLRLVNYRKIGIMTLNDTICITKDIPGMSIDLSASAKGHGVDVVAKYLSDKGIENFMVEIGGELVTRGVNSKGTNWVIGINTPNPDASLDAVQLPVNISDKAMATSGNYRNFYKNGEITYAHIIDPRTGEARPSDILSASILANDCLTADAYATACMVLGKEKAISLIENNSALDACFIFEDKSTNKLTYYFTSGFKNLVDTTAIAQ